MLGPCFFIAVVCTLFRSRIMLFVRRFGRGMCGMYLWLSGASRWDRVAWRWAFGFLCLMACMTWKCLFLTFRVVFC